MTDERAIKIVTETVINFKFYEVGHNHRFFLEIKACGCSAGMHKNSKEPVAFCEITKKTESFVSVAKTMASTTEVQWLHSFPAQLSAATLFAPFDTLAAFYREKVIESDAAETKPTQEGMEFLRFRSGARVAKKRKSGDKNQEDDESGFRRKTYMIPAAFPGIIVKGSFLRKLPLVHHCVLIRTGTIFVQNPYKLPEFDSANPEVQRVIAEFELHNNAYPIYKVHRRQATLLPLRQMANLVTPAKPAPEREGAPEYAGQFYPFSFVNANNAVGFLTLYKRRRPGAVPPRTEGKDVRPRPTSLWAERRAADPDWGVPYPKAEYISASDSNPIADLIKETLSLRQRYGAFPSHVPASRQTLPYLGAAEEGDGGTALLMHTRLRIEWKNLSQFVMRTTMTSEERTDFVRTILLSFLTSRPEILMQLEAASAGVLCEIVNDIMNQMILAGAAFIWKNEWSFELRQSAYPPFRQLCQAYFGKIFYDSARSLTVTEKSRGACVRHGTMMYYDHFAKKQEKDDYPHMYELLDLQYNLRNNPTYMRTLFREQVLYAAPCPWMKTPRWIACSWSDFEMARSVASWLLQLSRKTVRFVPYKHREMGDIVAGKKEVAGSDSEKPVVKLTEDMPKGTVLFDEELYQRILSTKKFKTYDGTIITLTDEQLSAIRGVKQSPLEIVLGDPGTGKSTMFQVFLKLFGVENVHICCAYNTMASMHAKTALYSTSIDSANARFTRYTDPRKLDDVPTTAKARVLIVDEVGVVKLNHGSMLRNVYDPDILIFAGDINQMKAIGRGEILRGMMDVFENDPKVTTTLTVAHRANAGIARVHIARCLDFIKKGQGEKIYGMVDRIAAPPISFLSHKAVNTSKFREETLKPMLEKFWNDRTFWENFIGICRTHEDRRALQEIILRSSPLTRDIVKRRGFLGRRDLAVGELLKVVSRFKPYEREAPPLVPAELGNGSLMRVTRVLDVFTDGPINKSSSHLKAVLGGYLTQEDLQSHLSELEVEDLETTFAPTSPANHRRKRARLIILDHGLASFVLTEKTRDCFERGNVVTVASIQGGQFDNVMLWFTPTSTAAGANIGAFTEEKSMLYTGSSRAKVRIIFIGVKPLIGEISRRIERPRRNIFTAIIRQMAGMPPFTREFPTCKEFRLPLDEADYVQYEVRQ